MERSRQSVIAKRKVDWFIVSDLSDAGVVLSMGSRMRARIERSSQNLLSALYIWIDHDWPTKRRDVRRPMAIPAKKDSIILSKINFRFLGSICSMAHRIISRTITTSRDSPPGS
jgi:hypothetical protein